MTLSPGPQTFTGQIAGLGFAEGTRVVVGRWVRSPLGEFTDAMVERADGHRLLLAPTDEVAGVVSTLYRFDEVRVMPVTVELTRDALHLAAAPLVLDATVGGRTPLGRALAAVPSSLQRRPWWSAVTDPIARVVLDGVRTQGTTASGWPATYGATDHHRITAARATWEGTDLGALGDVTPPVRFGFGSTPEQPSLTSVTTTIDVPEPLTGVIDCWGVGTLREAEARRATAPRDGHAGDDTSPKEQP